MKAEKPFTQCPICVMDISDPDIAIGNDGCTYCKRYKQRIPQLPKFQDNAQEHLHRLVSKIKRAGLNKPYDCLIGVSGGVDSSYVAYYVKEVLQLRPLAVHLDNGWNDELAVHNIEKILGALKLDLWTEVIDWDEFRSLQMAFLKASVPDCDIPTDHAIVETLYKTAKKFGIKYILVGNNLVTESIMPHAWSRGHADWKYISSINKAHGIKKLTTFPHFGFFKNLYRSNLSSIKKERILSYIEFNKNTAAKLLEDKFNWQPYSGKHHESIFTKFYQAYWLLDKFGYDKRKGHLSALICAGQVTREEALKELSISPLSESDRESIKEYVADKFEITVDELDDIFERKNKSFFDYPSHYHCWQYYFLRSLYRKTLKSLLSKGFSPW